MSELLRVPLGASGMTITRVGVGAWAIGGDDCAFTWGPQDDAQSVAAIRHAVEHGINWIDTAPTYGLGHSEEVVGRALADYSVADRPYVFTKCGLVWDEHHRRAVPNRAGARHSIRTELEASLRRLRVDRVDLYQMHWPADDAPLEEYWGELLRIKAEGKARAVGLSNHTADQLARAERMGHVDTLQPPFSAIRRDTAERELPWCDVHNTGVIAYSPMQAGLLTGAFSRARLKTLAPDDWRRQAPEFTDEAIDRNLLLAEALGPIATRHDTTVAAVAVAWTLAWPGMSGAIVGARNPGQVDGWLPGARLTLSEADLDEIATAVERTGAGSGPARPPRRPSTSLGAP